MRDDTAAGSTPATRTVPADPGPDRSWVAEQLAAARARQDPEPPEPPLPALGDALRDLAADWGETLLAAWNSPHGRDLRLAARAATHAALAAIATWLAAITLCVTVWLVSAPDTAGIAGPLHVGAQLWLLGHHAALDVPAGRVALAPLGFTALLVLALWHTAATPVARPAHVAYTAFGAATGYCLIAALVAADATTRDVHPDTAQAVLFAVLFGALVPTAARWRRIIGFCDPPEWAATAGRAAAAGGAVLAGGGALVLAGTLAVHMPHAGWPHGAMDDAGMFLLSLALLPNAVAWSASFVLGSGFAVGTGTSVSMLSAKVGALPAFPMLGGLPRDNSHIFPYDLALLAVPMAAGTALGLIVLRAGERPLSAQPFGAQMRALSTAVAALAAAAGLLATLSGGPLADGRMTTLGPSGWRTAAATLLLLGLSAAAVVLARPSASAVRRLPRPARLVRRDEHRADLGDVRRPAVDQVPDTAHHADAEEDGGDDPGVVVPEAGDQGHPEPEPGADEDDPASEASSD